MIKICKKLLCVILILSIVLSQWVYAIDEADVSQPSEWAKFDIKRAEVAGIVYDTMLNNFQQNINRRDFCEVAVNLYWSLIRTGEYESKSYSIYTALFDDIKPEDYDIKAAYGLGIVKGHSERVFAPDDTITREQLCVMLYRVLNLIDYKAKSAELTDFDDYEDISDWAKEEVGTLFGLGVIKGFSDSEIAPQGFATKEEAMVMAYRIFKKVTGVDFPLPDEKTLEVLIEAGVFEKDFFEKSDYIPTRELFEILNRVRGITVLPELFSWNDNEELETFTWMSNSDKYLVNSVLDSFRGLLVDEEIYTLDLNKEVTYYEALVYITRLLGSTYSCTDGKDELYYTERIQTYENALEKGIIDEINMDNGDLLITREDFAELLYKALFVKVSVGGIMPYSFRYIDEFLEDKEPNETPDIVATEVFPEKFRVYSDMSVSWEIPNEVLNKIRAYWYEKVYVITEEGKETEVSFSTYSNATRISAKTLVEYMASMYPEKPVAVRYAVYYRNYFDNVINAYYYDIDISHITVETNKTEVQPLTYVKEEGKPWATELSLSDKIQAKGDVYYVLLGKEKAYKIDEYNHIDFSVFNGVDGTTLYTSTEEEVMGTYYTDEIRVQKATVTGDEDNGFILTLSKVSSETFEVK